MMHPASGAIAVTRALDALVRDDRGRLLSALIAKLRDFQLAEDCLQDALISAVTHWNRNGLPHSPHGWLLQTAMRKAIDRFRQNKTASKFAKDSAVLARDEALDTDEEDIPDERLRLIFTCCHPAIEPKSQVALTLRTLGGLTTGEIARAFLDQEATMGQRLSRAKAKIAAAGIPFRVPEQEEWQSRLQSVLNVVYLIFNAGYTAGPVSGRDLAEEAIYLARLLAQLKPGEAEVEGCLALLMITHARRFARVNAKGELVAIDEQDRSLWKMDEIAGGIALLDVAIARRRPGPFQIKAAIAACHCEAGGADWVQILALYDALLRFEGTPVVRLNRAAVLAELDRLSEAGLHIEALEKELAGYQPFYAVKAFVCSKAGKIADALTAYDEAIKLATSHADILFLKKHRNRVQ